EFQEFRCVCHVCLPSPEVTRQKRTTSVSGPAAGCLQWRESAADSDLFPALCSNARMAPMLLFGSLRSFFFRILLREGAHQIDEIPAHRFLRAVALADHRSSPVGEDIEELAVGSARQRGKFTPVIHLELHRFDKITFAIAILAVAHRALIFIEAASFAKSLGCGRNRILPCRFFRRNFGIRSRSLGLFGFFLYASLLCGQDSGTREQKRTQDKERTPHNDLLAVRAGCRSESARF